MAVAPQLVDISKHEFKEPKRMVGGPEDMDKWLTCQVICLHACLLHIVRATAAEIFFEFLAQLVAFATCREGRACFMRHRASELKVYGHIHTFKRDSVVNLYSSLA